MTIKVYPSQMPGEPMETHEHDLCTIGEWFAAHGLDYVGLESQPVTVSMNGGPVAACDWASTELQPSDLIEIRLIPHGGVFKALGSIIGKIFNVAFGWLMPSAKVSGQSQTEQGASLQAADAKANTVRLGSVVPEIAGRFQRFPDYLTPPHRFFVNGREQWLEFHVCIGPGEYDIEAGSVKVGNTPFESLGADAQYVVLGPNQSLEPYPTRDAWHNVAEVGGTSSGTAGLELSTETANRDNADPAYYVFNGSFVTRPDGEFPSGWGTGSQVNVEFVKPYTVVTQLYPEVDSFPAYSISRITGYFGHVSSEAGDLIFFGPINGVTQYRVRRVVSSAGPLKTIELETVAGANPVVLTAGPEQYLIFGANIPRTITAYTGAEFEVSPAGFDSSTVYGARVRFFGGTTYGEWTSEFAVCPAQETSGVIEFDIFFPNGLGFIQANGSVINRGVGIEFQYRNSSGGPRVTFSRYYENATLDQIGFTERISAGHAHWLGRMRRIGAESTDTQVQDRVFWYGLKSLLVSKWNYPNWTTMMVRLRSGGRIAAQSENQINLVATRRLPRLQGDGTWTGPQATRDISSFARHIALSIGYTDADLDMDELRRLDSIWKERWDSFDHVFDLTTVKAALNTTFGAGMAELTIDDGQIKPVREGIRTQFEQAYSPQNMTSPLRRTFAGPKPDDPDGVEVEYVDERTWTKETVRCLLPEDEGFKIETVKLDGVTNRDRAWRYGMRQRRAQRYQNWQYNFSTEMDALNSGYLSYVPLVDDIPGYGQSAILEHIEAHQGGALLHLSEPLSWFENTHHVIAYRRPDGTLVGPFDAHRGEDDYMFISAISQPWPEVTLKHEPPHVYFGPVERWSFPALVTNIRPNGMDEVSVTAKKYDGRVYADDNNNAPN